MIYRLSFLRFHEDRGTVLWDRYVSQSVIRAPQPWSGRTRT